VVNAAAVAYVLVMVVLLTRPPNQEAGQALAATVTVLVVAWHAGVKRVFRGPAQLAGASAPRP
jgi:hypothetical protein